MSDFSELIEVIEQAIKTNNNEEITGAILQGVLKDIVEALGDEAINALETALQNEINARTLADTALGGRIDAEVTARQLGDSTLQGGINTAMQAINAINNAITNGCVYAGIATPSSTPASGKVFYLAFTAGTYTNFNSLVVPQGINILKNNGSTWSLDSFLGIDDAPTPSSNKLVKSGGVFNDIMTNGSAFDLTAYNNGTTYADLNAALTALNALPAAYKKGGMSLKYVQTYDNKYVQYRLMSNSFNTTEANWQGVDDEPTAGSENLVKSGGVAKNLENIINGDYVDDSESVLIENSKGEKVVEITDDYVKIGTKNLTKTIENIETEDTSEPTEEIDIVDKENNVVAKIKSDGIYSKGYKTLEGKDILDTERTIENIIESGNTRGDTFTWCAIGDSFTANNDNTVAIEGGFFTKGYMTRVCEKVKNLTYVNKGMGGAKIYQALGQTLPVADIYSIMFGTNDWWSNGLTIGTISDYNNQTASGEIFLANLGALVKKIRDINPDASILVMFPTHNCYECNRGSFEYPSLGYERFMNGNFAKHPNNFSWEDLRDAVKTAINQDSLGNIQLVDFLEEIPITKKNIMNFARVDVGGVMTRVKFPDCLTYIAEKVDAGETFPWSAYDNECSYMKYDGCHPSDLEYEAMASILIPIIKKALYS